MDDDAWNEDEEDGLGEAGNVDDSPDGDGEETTTPCPYCKRPIYDDSYRCPHCGNYLSEEDATPSRKPWWIIVGVLLVLLIVYHWITW